MSERSQTSLASKNEIPVTQQLRLFCQCGQPSINGTPIPKPCVMCKGIAEIERLQRDLWTVAECIFQNVSSDDAKHWARGIRVSIRNGEPPSFAVETSGESAWLIEMAGERDEPLYWHAVADMRCIGGFDPDVNKAVRFCREQDARDMARMLGAKGMIALVDVSRVKITEHEWTPLNGNGEHA